MGNVSFTRELRLLTPAHFSYVFADAVPAPSKHSTILARKNSTYTHPRLGITIAKNRVLMGATNPKEADSGTIRADFADSIDANAVHGSDGPDTAAEEINFFFKPQEICA
mgnify:CR=1 FL=1